MLTWEQVVAWRLSQQHLLKRAEDMLAVVNQIGGLHAQVFSAAELQLWARMKNPSADAVQNGLWRDRTLVKTWAMRGTLHLLTASAFPQVIAALSTLKHYRRASWQKYHGVTLDELEAIIESLRVTLTDDGLTREQLAEAAATQTNLPKLRELLLSGWGSILKPAAFQGHLCFGPNQGQNVTFVHPARWIGAWTQPDPQAALQEVTRHYLNVYGPATPDDFARWFGLESADAKRVFRSLGDEIQEVNVDSWKAWMLTSALQPMQTLRPAHTIRLLPLFDPYVIAMPRGNSYILPDAHKNRVYRPQGWISPVILVDGRIVGVWEHDKKAKTTLVKMDAFAPLNSEIKAGIEAETQRLSAFLGTPVQVEF